MPLYDYKCQNGHIFEVMQSFSSKPGATCDDCGTPATRQLSIPMVVYKGSGFYTTDYGRNGSASSSSKSDSNGEASKPKSKSKSKETAKSGASKSGSSD